MTDVENKRIWVSEMYPGPRWKKAVAKMPDSQVVAIYLREQKKQNDTGSKESNDDPTPF